MHKESQNIAQVGLAHPSHLLNGRQAAMATEDRGPLGGTVEMGDNWSEPDVQAKRYPLVFGAVAVLNRAPRGERSGRLYLVHVQEPYPFERSWRSLIKHVDHGARLKCWPPLGCDLERPIHREYTPHIDRAFRSEEHTSELQSPMYLVCRLLLEKK